MDANFRAKIEMVATSVLKADPRNARNHPAKQIAQLVATILRFGFAVPILVDQNNVIIAGHGRWEAAKQLGLAEVPVIRVHILSDVERRAFALADNRLAELSSWDPEILSRELEILFESGFDVTTIGFSTSDLDFAIVGEKETEPTSSKAERVDLPDPDQQATSRVGDLWLIGPHRLLCGDARHAVSWEALLADDRANLVFADPPYNVPINGHVSGTGRHHEFVMAAGELSAPEFTTFLRAVFRNCVRFSVDGSIHYQCMDFRHIREILDAADGVYHQFKQLIVWVREGSGPSIAAATNSSSCSRPAEASIRTTSPSGRQAGTEPTSSNMPAPMCFAKAAPKTWKPIVPSSQRPWLSTSCSTAPTAATSS
jgi:hypothetical protein